MERLLWKMFLPVAMVAITYIDSSRCLDLWLTTGDQTRLLSFEGQVEGQTTSYPGVREITVDGSAEFQAMVGFGAAVTNSAAYLLYNSPSREELLTRLFSLTDPDGIGIEMVRLTMGGSDFNAVDPYTYDDVDSGEDFDLEFFSIEKDQEFVLPLLRMIRDINPNVKIVATPWSAPAWMKSSENLFGGSMKEGAQYLDVLARYFVRFIQAYEQEGVPVEYIILQNEPLHSVNDYPTMYMTAQTQTELIRDHVGPAFEAAGITTHLLVYDHNWDEPGYPDSILADPDAARFVHGSAWHCYAGDKNAPDEIRQKYPDKAIFFTECSGGEWDTDFGSVLGWNVQNLFIGQTRVGAAGVLLWNFALDQDHGPRVGITGGCEDCRGVFTIYEDSTFTLNSEFYSIGQFSKFIRQGAVYIDSSAFPDDLEAAAFKNTDGRVAVVILNTSWDTAKSFQVLNNGLYYLYEDLPARSVITFVEI